MACKLPDSFEYLIIPRWIYEVDGTEPLDRELCAHIWSYAENGKTCFESNQSLRDRFDVGKGKLEGSLKRLERLGVLSRTYQSNNQRILKVDKPTALYNYLNAHPPKNRTLPEIQEPTRNSEGLSLPDNQEPTRKSEGTLPENLEGATRNSGYTNKITKTNDYILSNSNYTYSNNNIYPEQGTTQEGQTPDFWKEWGSWFKNACRMKLPPVFMKYIRNHSEQSVRITTRNITRAFEGGYDKAAILESAFRVRFADNPEQALTEALKENRQASQEFQAETADYMLNIREQALTDFCREKKMDVSTFRQALEQKYALSNFNAEGSP